MTRSAPPPIADKPSIASVADYFRQGAAHLRSAVETFADLDPPAALIAMHQQGERLRPVTARRYFEDDRRALEAFLRLRKRAQEVEHWVEALRSALAFRSRSRGKHGERLPSLPKRTSSGKVIDATEYEARTAFFHLKQQALENGNIHTIIACLFVLVANHSGLRPIELIGARLQGTVLTLVNAKARYGAESNREIDLGPLHADVVTGVGLLIDLMPDFPSRRSFVLFRNRLREALRRACIRGAVRELALYSFRHIAISTWARAGMSPSDIARLAGHSSVLTAGRHYARANVGHDREAVARPVPVKRIARVQGQSVADDDMPTPKAMPKNSSNANTVSAADLARAKRKWAGDDMPSIEEPRRRQPSSPESETKARKRE